MLIALLLLSKQLIGGKLLKRRLLEFHQWSAAAVREEKNRIVDVTKNAKIHLRQMLESHKEQMRLYKDIIIFLPTALLRSITSCEQRSQVLRGNKAKT